MKRKYTGIREFFVKAGILLYPTEPGATYKLTGYWLRYHPGQTLQYDLEEKLEKCLED